jgi:gliding motility-associated-like protein
LRKKYLLILRLLVGVVCIGYSHSARAQLAPDFKADTTQGCAPVVIKFRDLSSGNPTSWLWDLGNGITSTEQNPTTFYFDAGKYTVRLTVTNSNGTETIEKDQYITLYEIPKLAFQVTDSTGCFPLNVKFTDLSEAGSGTVQSRQWDYGDGTFSNLPVSEHSYKVAGNFTISLKVTNSFGCSQLLSKPALIKVTEGVMADFDYIAGITCNPPTLIQFKDRSIGKNITSFSWNFGDGDNASTQNPVHTYASQGLYTVSLAVKNAAGCTDTIEKQNVVQVDAVKALFTTSDTICQKTPVTFTNVSSPIPVSVFWKFGDGTFSTAMNPVKTFSNAGSYTVTMISNFGSCSDSITKVIQVLPSPSANFTISSILRTCSLPIKVDFNNSDPGVSSLLWNFGDGATSTSAITSHTYTDPGSFSVSLEVIGVNGCLNKVTKTNLIYFGPPVITKFIGVPYKGCVPYTAKLSAAITAPEPIATYLWDFGDGTTSTSASPSHTYSDTGHYNISLDITTVSGCKGSYTLPNAVILSSKPTANFSASPREACAFEKIYFSDSSTGVVTGWIWAFGDGGVSSLQNPVRSYVDTGFFDVTLIATNNFCADTLVIPDFIYINPPVAKFDVGANCSAPELRHFTSKSIGATNWSWSFGDGDTSTEENPDHTYSGSGDYNVTLEVTNGTCKDKRVQTIWVIDEKPILNVSDTSLCKNISVDFLATNIDTALISTYSWSFGDGNTITTSLASVSYHYLKAGTFFPRLMMTDKNGCKDSSHLPVTINVYGPSAEFSTNGGACLRSEMTMKDLSESFSSFPITTWIWNFGDGSVDTLTSGLFKHTYQSEGLFDVELSVIDSYGCKDTLLRPKAVLITNPRAAFSLADSLNCTRVPVTFTDSSKGYNLRYKWSFGDGDTSNQKNIVHNYANEGEYNIKLVITDTFGCRDSLLRSNAVRVANVVAKMVISDTGSSCPPFIMTLWNKSENYSSISWDFNDGSFSNLDSPSHYYNFPGVYKIKLTANGYGGCSDSTVKTITLKGPSGRFKYTPFNICSPGQASFTATTTNKATFIWDFGDGTTLPTTDSTVQHSYINPGRYKPKLLLKDVAGCQVPIIGKDTITIIKADANIKSATFLFCDSTTVQFFDSSFAMSDVITKYVWSFGDGKKDSTNKNPSHSYTSAGNFAVSLKIFTSNGCSDTAYLQAPLKVVPSPSIDISASRGVCINEPVTFSGLRPRNDTTQVQWEWWFGDGDTAHGQHPAMQYYSHAGSYKIKAVATNSSGCSTAYTVPFNVYPAPLINAGTDTTICLGQTITLTPTGAETYRWNADPTLNCSTCQTPSAKPGKLTTYIVNGTSLQGCKNADTIDVNVIKPFSINTSPADTLCIGESVRLFASGSHRYSWYPATGLSNTSIATPVAKPSITTIYQVAVSDSQNCFVDTGSIKITVYPIPVFDITTKDSTLSVGQSMTLNTSNSPDINQWRWVPYVGLNCHDCPQPVATPRNTTTYTAQAWNEAGCKAEDRVTITVICNGVNIFVPNTFSPNNDGANDVFYPRGKGIASVKSLTIFNRWGLVVYQKTNFNMNDQQAGWNGTYNGVKLSPDVFVYKMDVVCENNQIFDIKGNVTLIN